MGVSGAKKRGRRTRMATETLFPLSLPKPLGGYEIIRVVHTLHGGDRPKNTHEEFVEISVMPESC